VSRMASVKLSWYYYVGLPVNDSRVVELLGAIGTTSPLLIDRPRLALVHS
jgi:hypothetical protein